MAGSSPNGSSPGSMSSVTAGAMPPPFPPPRTRCPSFRRGLYPRSEGEDKSNFEDIWSRESERRRPEHPPFPLVTLEPDVQLDRAGRLVLLGDGRTETDRPVRENEPAKRRPEPAERPRSRPR